MRCLLIGSGSVGKSHVKALRSLVPDAEFVALRSGKGGALPDGAIEREVRDIDAALLSKPDIVIVANPAPFHPESAIPFVAAGLAVLIEKPVAVDSAGMRALFDAASGNSRVLVGYVLRHDPALERFCAEIDNGTIGNLIMLHLEAGQALGDWRHGEDLARSISARRDTGGGVLFELSHEIDSACRLLGEIECVQAVAASRGVASLEVEDTAAVLLRFKSGEIAVVQIDMARRTALRRYRAIGSAGTLVWTAAAGSVCLELDNDVKTLHRAPLNRDDLFRLQMQHFLDVARGTAKPKCTLEDGAQALAGVLAARRKANLDAVAA